MASPLSKLMPSVLRHAGVWEGTYRHIDCSGNTLDFHRSRVECLFPMHGTVVYIQKNEFTWDDGHYYRAEFSGVLKNDRIFWNTATFRGYGWAVSTDVFVLELERKDEPGVSFYESIVLGKGAKHRARTWHWFKEGICFKRTLCNERRVG